MKFLESNIHNIIRCKNYQEYENNYPDRCYNCDNCNIGNQNHSNDAKEAMLNVNKLQPLA